VNPTPRARIPVWAAATLPKLEHSKGENEDAVGGSTSALRFAVADGATEGWKSGEWACHLVAEYVRCPPMPATFPAWLERVRKIWPEGNEPPSADEPWFAHTKRDEGAYSTLAGLELKRRSDGSGWRWKAVAAGDSCLFLIRRRRIVTSFPLEKVEQFGLTPNLLASSPALPWVEPEWLAGTAEAGDVLALATDAVAAGLMRSAAKTDEPWFIGDFKASNPSCHNRDLSDFMLTLPCPRDDDRTLLAVCLPSTRVDLK